MAYFNGGGAVHCNWNSANGTITLPVIHQHSIAAGNISQLHNHPLRVAPGYGTSHTHDGVDTATSITPHNIATLGDKLVGAFHLTYFHTLDIGGN